MTGRYPQITCAKNVWSCSSDYVSYRFIGSFLQFLVHMIYTKFFLVVRSRICKANWMSDVTVCNISGIARHKTVGTLVPTRMVKCDNFLIACCSRQSVWWFHLYEPCPVQCQRFINVPIVFRYPINWEVWVSVMVIFSKKIAFYLLCTSVSLLPK